MATFYLKSGAGATDFQQSTAYTLGQKMVPARADAGTNFAVGRKWVWECTTAGTTAAANPTWSASYTQDVSTLTSGTAVFTARKPGFSSGTTANWAFAAIYLDYVTGAMTTGDVLYVSNNHAESVTGAITPTNVSCYIICVDDSAAPPTATATTASFTATTSLTVPITTRGYVYGCNFIAGSGTSTAVNMNLAGSGGEHVLENCTFTQAGTHASSSLRGNATNVRIELINCGVKFGNASQSFSMSSGVGYFKNCYLMSGGTSPTNFYASGGNEFVEFHGLDLTNASASINLHTTSSFGSRVKFFYVKAPTSWSGQVCGAANSGLSSTEVEGHAVDSSGTNYRYQLKEREGTAISETSIVRTGGASDGTTALSWKITSASTALFPHATFRSTPIAIWNDTTGSAKTATIYIAHDGAAAFKNNEVWAEFIYMSDSGDPLGTLITTRCADYMATPGSYSSSGTWPNATGTGPNGSSTWNLLALTTASFTPQQKGYIVGRVYLALASKTIYVDPTITVA